MVDDLDGLYKWLSLTEQAETKVIVESSRLGDVSLCRGTGLVMTFLSEKHFNREAFKLTMKRSWCPVQVVRF